MEEYLGPPIASSVEWSYYGNNTLSVEVRLGPDEWLEPGNDLAERVAKGVRGAANALSGASP